MDAEKRLAELGDHIVAVQYLLLSHIAAMEVCLPGSATATIDIAKTQFDAALKARRMRIAIRLDALIDAIREGCDLPVND